MDHPSARTADSPSDVDKPSTENFWAIAPVVALAAFMEVLDLSIANVSLLHIAGSLAVSQDEATWVLTSYTMTNAIILPLSGWLASVLGRKRYFMGCIVAFSMTSLLCGLAPSLGFLVLFRALQGIVGGGLQPNAQAILSDAAPPAKRGMAFALYGIAVVFAPAIGPTLGGWITDHLSWRWVFLINVPVGFIILPLVRALVRDPAHHVKARRARLENGIRLDYIGFSLITLGLGCMQIVLDRGQQDDWFGSSWIAIMTVVFVAALIGFVVWEWHRDDPIVDLHLLKNRGFAVANILMFMLGFVLLGSTALLPLYAQSLLGYTAVDAGLVLSPGGFAIMLMMPIVGQLVSRMDLRWLIAGGFLFSGISTLFMAGFDTQTGFSTIMWVRVFQAAGMAFLFIPINTAAFADVPTEKSSNASAIINMSRNIGGSIGISIATTILERRAQYHQSVLVDRLTPFSPIFHSYMTSVQNTLSRQAYGAGSLAAQATGQLYQTVLKQSTMLAYIDDFKLMGAIFIALAPMVFLMNRGAKGTARADVH